MRPSTEQIVQTVETLSGYPVHMAEDASLQVDASIRIGTAAKPVHLLRYRPMKAGEPDYYIAYQCGFVIRLYQAPPDRRFDLSPTPEGVRKVESLVAGTLAGLKQDQYRDMLLNGLGYQLRSVPVGLRIDGWIGAEHPDLKDLQEQAVKKQLQDNLRLLEGPLRSESPAKIFEASVAMLAAFAAYWARAWGDAKILQPYKLVGLLDKGERLLKLLDTMSADPADDPELVEAWAFELGIKGWYRWVPREAAGR